MREKFKQVAAERMAAEQKVGKSLVDPNVLYVTNFLSINVLNGAHPEEGNEGTATYQADERPCPACRGAISKDRIFSRAAFEPTDTELNGTMDGSSHTDEDYEMADVEAAAQTNPKVNTPRRPRKRVSRKVVHGSPDYEDDEDMSDFIMQSDEDEEEKDRRRRARISLGKQKEKAILISDDSESDDDIVYRAKRGRIAARQQVQPMPRFLPSTKMKCMMESLRTWARDHPNEKVGAKQLKRKLSIVFIVSVKTFLSWYNVWSFQTL
ncbi:hypothetical protein PHLCEN_2v8617 [Hermanssonia centrifuga]|uniref:Uncharacterized protein n=1 Tax=Hermanssonia centrifuga TaxID=98765 RepID=A0A2R6NT63_9APHY|nr:hypothetical protein PHLCEN_2v8617 [Hermanssonia centrifuga]